MEVNVLQERVTEQEKFNSKGSKRSVQRPSDLKIGSVQRLQDDIRELEKRKKPLLCLKKIVIKLNVIWEK